MPLRVAILARSVYPLHRFGGLERHVFDLIRHLIARDVHVTLLAPPRSSHRPADGIAEALFSDPRVSFRPVPYLTFPFANRRGTTIIDRSTAYPLFGRRAGRVAAALVSSGHIDIVHGLGASALGYAAAPAQLRARAPLVINPQGMEEFGATDPSAAPLKRLGYWPLRRAVRQCARAAARIIATDRVLLEPVVRHLRVPREIVRVIPNAIDFSEFDKGQFATRAQALLRGIGARPDELIMVSVGRLESNKGFDVMVNALAVLATAKRLPSRWKWVLIGDGPQRGSLRSAAASAGLVDHVVFAGRPPSADVHGWYEAATFFVHPTRYEGSSLVTLEAMGHRRAVVGTRAGGIPDKVIPGTTGWLVDPGDVSGLAAAIDEAVHNRSRLHAMGDAGRALALREFSWDAAADRTVALYRELRPQNDSL